MTKNLFGISVLLLPALFYQCGPSPSGGVIADTHWMLRAYSDAQRKVTVDTTLPATLYFGQNTINGRGPCNSFFGNYTQQKASLVLTPVAATKKACEELPLESTFFAMLAEATGYTAKEEGLTIFSPKGKLHFQKLSEDQLLRVQFREMLDRIPALFPPIAMNPPIHVYPTLVEEYLDGYPFKGIRLDTSLFALFAKEIAAIWNQSGGDVFAIGEYEGFYLCRIPGRYVSSDIAIYRRVNDTLVRSETIAWAWCDEGWCNQQDAWLQDLNRDGLTDMVQRYQLTDDKGKLQEERLTVLLQMTPGRFEQDFTIQPDRMLFQMAKLN